MDPKVILYDGKGGLGRLSGVKFTRGPCTLSIVNTVRRYLLTNLSIRRIRGIRINDGVNYMQDIDEIDITVQEMISRLARVRLIDSGMKSVVKFKDDSCSGPITASQLLGKEVFEEDAKNVIFTCIKPIKIQMVFDLAKKPSESHLNESVYSHDSKDYAVVNHSFVPIKRCAIEERQDDGMIIMTLESHEKLDHAKVFSEAFAWVGNLSKEISKSISTLSLEGSTKIEDLMLSQSSNLMLNHNGIFTVSDLAEKFTKEEMVKLSHDSRSKLFSLIESGILHLEDEIF